MRRVQTGHAAASILLDPRVPEVEAAGELEKLGTAASKESP